jgi:hypothetical protein
MTMREGESALINGFVEHLWQGRLWGLGPDMSQPESGKSFLKAAWHGRTNLPPREDARAWMKIVMPFLKEVTGDNPMRLNVFEHMLAARRFVYHDASGEGHGRLATDSTKYVWNQVETEIRKAWVTMAKRARKPNPTKPA